MPNIESKEVLTLSHRAVLRASTFNWRTTYFPNDIPGSLCLTKFGKLSVCAKPGNSTANR
jgi:hypothetical protein